MKDIFSVYNNILIISSIYTTFTRNSCITVHERKITRNHFPLRYFQTMMSDNAWSTSPCFLSRANYTGWSYLYLYTLSFNMHYYFEFERSNIKITRPRLVGYPSNGSLFYTNIFVYFLMNDKHLIWTIRLKIAFSWDTFTSILINSISD